MIGGIAMNGNPSSVRGIIQRVEFDGAGPNSGEIGIHLDDHQSYWVFMDTPAPDLFQIFQSAVRAMWDVKTVEITYALKSNGDWGVLSIRTV